MRMIRERILCPKCPYLEKGIKEEGEKFGVEYVVLESNEKFIICDNPNISWDKIMNDLKLFDITYVPKFGKYEIEQFVGYFMKEALLISKDITDLFNMELLCDDYPFNTTRVNKETIRERLLKCFNVVQKDNNTTYLSFKWERWDKL